MNQHIESGQNFSDRLDWGRRVLVPAQVDHDPSDIAQESDRDLGIDEGQERFDHA